MKTIIRFFARYLKGFFLSSLLLLAIFSLLAFILFFAIVVEDYLESESLYIGALLWAFSSLLSGLSASWLLWFISKKNFPILGWKQSEQAASNVGLAFGREQQSDVGQERKCIEIDVTPDPPEPFAYKLYWFTVKSDDAKSVVDALDLSDVQSANWASGMHVSCGRDVPAEYENYAFITPSIQGWVFVLSRRFGMSRHIEPELKPSPEDGFDLMFHRLYTKFPDVQFFGSYRVVGAVAWARALEGKVVRMFAEAEGVYANVGQLTKEEHSLNILDIGGLTTDQADEKIRDYIEQSYALEDQLTSSGISLEKAEEKVRKKYPFITPDVDEELPLQLAEMWSVNPSKLAEMDLPRSVGFIGKLPDSLVERVDAEE